MFTSPDDIVPYPGNTFDSIDDDTWKTLGNRVTVGGEEVSREIWLRKQWSLAGENYDYDYHYTLTVTGALLGGLPPVTPPQDE
jgi:hypothetical protein